MGCLRSPHLGFGLYAVKKIHGLLGMCGGAKDGALVVLEDGEPACNVSCMVVADFWRDAKIRAKECAGKLGYQLLAGIAFIALRLAAKAAVKP